MSKYKPDQGTYARTASFLLLAALAVFGCHSLYYWLLGFRGEGGEHGGMATDLLGGPVPVVGAPLTPALLAVVALGVALVWTLHSLLNRPKVADTLIECETEMRKCTWPSFNETWKSSIVVVVVVLFFTAVLAFADVVLNYVTSNYVF